MPELPEVEVVRRGLAAHTIGAVIDTVTVRDRRSLRRHLAGHEDFIQQLEGATIADICRRGKYLWLLLAQTPEKAACGEVENLALVIHLGMSGQVLLKEPTMPDEKHQKIVLHLSDATDETGTRTDLTMRFVDQRIFGGMHLDTLVPTTDRHGTPLPAASSSTLNLPLVPASVAHIARDPLDPHFEFSIFRQRMLKTNTGIKKLLLDQSSISGVGNIYADEALWRARLHYAKPAKNISATQARQLIEAATDVMRDALAQGGTSFDALYVNVNGESGYFDRSLKAYGQAGKPCPRCLGDGRTSIMVREPFGGRSSYRCPHCQRKPRGVKP
ncbi:MAG: bifunctional DNA-formamidopyrimidine glycosylase/DNA-(apurinic or apyrimidinic site) lyase [Rothia sp. (in: high G+C Gram-positive bacteria)]|nr:bifunctional DNA-formamidopyrimidine glycosylase/DNA-(apurinic or apyrimidinic site) lyase [Rothia sp. (in: high G+C Gram-positive bacteria)]